MSVQAVDPRSGSALKPSHEETPAAAIRAAAGAAAAAFARERIARTFDDATLLRAVADELEDDAEDLRAVAAEETGLADDRLVGELARTTGQLRAFAGVVERGELVDAIIDRAVPNAQPPRPDQRRMNIPIGPIAVYAASNFPFAFSVAGGDTAAAWAAGCPVLVKAHPGHPGTSVRTGAAIERALARVGAPAAWFALVSGARPETGIALAEADAVEAIAFTGSQRVGTELLRVAAARPRPIPVYAEMGSINPVFVTPAAAAARGPAIAAGLAAAITGSVGQLCTKPGVVSLVDDAAGQAIVAALADELTQLDAAPMLTAGLRDRFAAGFARAAEDPRVERLVMPRATTSAGAWPAPGMRAVRADRLDSGDPLLEELFGPGVLIAWCRDQEELVALAAERVSGSLTATVHGEEGDATAEQLWRRLALRVGRLIHNGYPTGVTVGHATVHGGPYPATTAPAHTSVGMTAARRFLRPVGFQAAPAALLPPELQNANPLGLMRLVDGEPTREPIV